MICLELGWDQCVMFTFLKILIVVVLALVLIDWIAGQQAKSWTNIPNAPAGWASVSSNFKIRSAMANESPQGTAPLLEETFLPGDFEYVSPNGTRIYFPVVTAILLALVLTLILRVWGAHPPA
jgi:hypothetical protein